MPDDKDNVIDGHFPEVAEAKPEEELQQVAEPLLAQPQPIPPEKRTWAEYMARTSREMLLEAIEYLDHSVEKPENIRAILVMFNPDDMHKPENLMSQATFEAYLARAKVTDPEVVFLAKYLIQDVFLHYVGIR